MAYQEEVLAARSGSLTIEDKKKMWKANRLDDEVTEETETTVDVVASETVDVTASANVEEIPTCQSDVQYLQDTYTITSEEEKTTPTPRKPRKKRYNYNDGQEDA